MKNFIPLISESDIRFVYYDITEQTKYFIKFIEELSKDNRFIKDVFLASDNSDMAFLGDIEERILQKDFCKYQKNRATTKMGPNIMDKCVDILCYLLNHLKILYCRERDADRDNEILYTLHALNDLYESFVITKGLADLLIQKYVMVTDGKATIRSDVFYDLLMNGYITIPSKLSVKDIKSLDREDTEYVKGMAGTGLREVLPQMKSIVPQTMEDLANAYEKCRAKNYIPDIQEFIGTLSVDVIMPFLSKYVIIYIIGVFEMNGYNVKRNPDDSTQYLVKTYSDYLYNENE